MSTGIFRKAIIRIFLCSGRNRPFEREQGHDHLVKARLMRFHFRRLDVMQKTSQGKAQPLRLFTFVETMFSLGFVTMRFFLRPTSNEHHSRDVIKCAAYLKSTLNDRYCSNVTNDLHGALIFYYLAILQVTLTRYPRFPMRIFIR